MSKNLVIEDWRFSIEYWKQPQQHLFDNMIMNHQALSHYQLFKELIQNFSIKILIVEDIGVEPMTPCVQGRCSKPTELIPLLRDYSWPVNRLTSYLPYQLFNLSTKSPFFSRPDQIWTGDPYIISVVL